MNDLEAWTEANKLVLAAEFDHLKALMTGNASNTSAIDQHHSRLPAPAASDVLASLFGLSSFERNLVLLCAGVEIDAELARLCGEAGLGRPAVTYSLALAVLPDAHWSALAPAKPLRRWRLVEPEAGGNLTLSRLIIDERIVHYLTGINYLDPRIDPLLRAIPQPELIAPTHSRIARQIGRNLTGPGPVIQLTGNDPDGKRDVAATVAEQQGAQLYALSAADIPEDPHERQTMATIWQRESALLDAALLIECSAPLRQTAGFADQIATPLFIATTEPLALTEMDLRFRIDKPSRPDQVTLLGALLNGNFPSEPAADRVAAEFRLSARQLQFACSRLSVDDDSDQNLWKACLSVKRSDLDGLAQRIESAVCWDDLILPEAQRLTLRGIVSQVKHRQQVYETWGFEAKGSRGLGISALFSGESGTGKTMAAEVMANELQLDLYRIDLSAVVSKYIGETEKNLARIFDAAEGGGVILLFDEADALFGKRSEVKDSHDRYANLEVSYLLQRMESYRGLAILTTNQKAALDPAFSRRLRFVVHFPFPDTAHREKIWRRIFPQSTPVGDLSYSHLARLHMSGGHLRNVAMNAAFRAAEDAEPVGMQHLLQAARAEAARTERSLTDTETRGWV